MVSDSSANTSESTYEQYYNRPIDGQGLKRLVGAGLSWLKTNHEIVNKLNVFPVPDGDTGTNMVLTMQAACDEVINSTENNVGKMSHAIAHGALMGARGNSGVILSQLWRGFARALDNQETMDGKSLVRAFAEGRDTAYKGVVRPVEGTILTVAKDVAAAATLILNETENPVDILGRVIPEADKSVIRTPELLPVLKQAGVVDSGGKGLFYILEGMFRYINGQSLDTPLTIMQPITAMKLEESMSAVQPGQDLEYVIDFRPKTILQDNFYPELDKLGTSIQLGEGDGFYRLHIHVPYENKGKPVEYIESTSFITKYTYEDLTEQMGEALAKPQSVIQYPTVTPGSIAVIAVTPGLGIARIFASLGAAACVEGGQTMNPSTQEIISTFEDLPTDKIIILPNNKNIILAAQAATQLSVKNIRVVPCKSVPQGLSALFCHNPNGDLDEVFEEMSGAISEVETGEITTATRTVEIDGVKVNKGQVIALHNGKLALGTHSLRKTCLGFLEKAQAEQRENITLFYGEMVSEKDATEIAKSIRKNYPSQQIEIKDGGQPHYQFIISVE